MASRLTLDDHEARLARILSAQLFAQLDDATADLIVLGPQSLASRGRTNSHATASLACASARTPSAGTGAAVRMNIGPHAGDADDA